MSLQENSANGFRGSRPSQAKQSGLGSYVHREGEWFAPDKQKILDLIRQAYLAYGHDLERQINFLHSNLEAFLGKRVQILIMEKNATQGHCLFAVNSKYLEAQFEGYTYFIWRVKLIEDIPLQKEY